MERPELGLDEESSLSTTHPQGGGQRLEYSRDQEDDNAQFGADFTSRTACSAVAFGVTARPDVAGEEDLFRITAEVFAVLIEDVTLVGEVLRRLPGESGCSAQRPSLPAATRSAGAGAGPASAG